MNASIKSFFASLSSRRVNPSDASSVPTGKVAKATRRSLKTVPALVYLSLATLCVAAPELAMAASTVGDVATSVNTNIDGVQNVLSGGAYLAGAYFAIKSLLAFKDHGAGSDGQTKLGKPLMLLTMATVLLGLPGFMSVGADSLFGSGTGATMVDHSY